MNRNKWITVTALWLVLESQAQAHPPHIESWKHAANLTTASLIGLSTGVLMRKKFGITVAIVAGLIVGILCGFLGFIVSIVGSM